MKTLLIDNYDSFTFNLYQLIAEVNRIPPIVIRNDAASWEEVQALDFDNIVISPGPGRPENESDFGICKNAILEANVPVMGVCLGHQGICHFFGGEVDYAEDVMHGRPSDIIHNGIDIFKNIPSPYSAIRYHSLYVKKLPEIMQKLAWTESGMVMGAKHKTRPIWSVQFHPESIKTEYGHQLFENFRAITVDRLSRNDINVSAATNLSGLERKYDVMYQEQNDQSNPNGGVIHGKHFKIHYRRLPLTIDAESVFANIYKNSSPSFWLDSALVGEFSRFSYMGDTTGPHAEFLTYRVNEKKVKVESQGKTEIFEESIFDYLNRMMKERSAHVDDLPFDFNLGYAGFLGYELKAECGFDSPHESYTPDAALVFSDRMIAFDHEENIVYLLCLDDVDNTTRAYKWLDDIAQKLKKMLIAPNYKRVRTPKPIKQSLRLTEAEYLARIQSSQVDIKKGETYEVCLTNMMTQHVEIDALNTYRFLRNSNPAPYAAYLNFHGVSVMSSSPERFITVEPNGVVESKPIKGTSRRGVTAEEDEKLRNELCQNEKDRSENLIIVDLLRNDIGQVCDVGSVHVNDLFAVETYATVHQLVSTVRGRLKRNISVIDCIQASFPGGSMTGAPKKRTIEIIDKLEGGARGIYSGSIGFLGLNGSADMSVVIRTIVKTDKDITIGVGGAIIDLSDPKKELDEMLLKSEALVNALSETNLISD